MPKPTQAMSDSKSTEENEITVRVKHEDTGLGWVALAIVLGALIIRECL